MRLYTSLLVAFCCALSLPLALAEPTLTRNEPIVDLIDVDVDAVSWSATASPESVVTTSAATIEILSVSKLNVPEAHPVRTTARLTVPPRAQWQTVLAGDSLTLALETGSLRVGLQDGQARIARATDSIHWIGGRTLDELAPGEEATMWAGDRLVVHGNGTLVVHGLGEMTAIATIVRVTTPH
jgi:hypothetical protein